MFPMGIALDQLSREVDQQQNLVGPWPKRSRIAGRRWHAIWRCVYGRASVPGTRVAS
jgi:hypothetical protein